MSDNIKKEKQEEETSEGKQQQGGRKRKQHQPTRMRVVIDLTLDDDDDTGNVQTITTTTTISNNNNDNNDNNDKQKRRIVSVSTSTTSSPVAVPVASLKDHCEVDACTGKPHAFIANCVHSSCNACSLIEVKNNHKELNGLWRKCPFCSRVEKVSQEYIDNYVDKTQSIAQGFINSAGKLGRSVSQVMSTADVLLVARRPTVSTVSTDDNFRSSNAFIRLRYYQLNVAIEQDRLYSEQLFREQGIRHTISSSAWDFPSNYFSEGRELTVREAFDQNRLDPVWMGLLRDLRLPIRGGNGFIPCLQRVETHREILNPPQGRDFFGQLHLETLFSMMNRPVMCRSSGIFRRTTDDDNDGYQQTVKRAYDAGILPRFIHVIIDRQLLKERDELAAIYNREQQRINARHQQQQQQ